MFFIIFLWLFPLSCPAREYYVFVVAPMMSPVITIETYRNFVKYISKRMGKPIQFVQKKTYSEANHLLATGEADFGHICTGAFLTGRNLGLRLLVAPVMYGKTYYQAYVIVHKDSPYYRLKDLRGKLFVFTDPLSLTGRLYIVTRLRELGTSPKHFFRRIFFSYSHDKSLELVAENVIDGASVDSLVYHYLAERKKELVQKLRIIEKSPPFGIPPLVASPHIETELFERLRRLLLEMDRDPAGRRVLRKMNIDRFVVPELEIYLKTLRFIP